MLSPSLVVGKALDLQNHSLLKEPLSRILDCLLLKLAPLLSSRPPLLASTDGKIYTRMVIALHSFYIHFVAAKVAYRPAMSDRRCRLIYMLNQLEGAKSTTVGRVLIA